MNEATAAMDLIENLGIPHTPWPLVQPLPSFVPNPTSRPATTAPPQPKLVSTDGWSNKLEAPGIKGSVNLRI
jgi:hypothetical protein